MASRRKQKKLRNKLARQRSKGGLSDTFHIAVCGDVHGHQKTMVRKLNALSKQLNLQFDLVLQVGDFEPHRDQNDLDSMAAPTKYKTLGDFAEFVRGHAKFEIPTYFIGGNHEPWRYLDSIDKDSNPAMPKQLCENLFFIGRGGYFDFRGTRIAGLSAIYREEYFEAGRPAWKSTPLSPKPFCYFSQTDVLRCLSADFADILLVHEWPDAVKSSSITTTQSRRTNREIGNSTATDLIELLRPRFVCAGHMHFGHRETLQVPGGPPAEFVGCAHIESRTMSIQVLRVDNGEISVLDLNKTQAAQPHSNR